MGSAAGWRLVAGLMLALTACGQSRPGAEVGADDADGAAELPAWPDAAADAAGDGFGCLTTADCESAFPDLSPCERAVCDPLTFTCVRSRWPERTPCDDGDACTIADRCIEARCVSGGTRDCDDGNACTRDSCDAALGCQHVPDEALACDDGDPCTAADACAASGQCRGDPLGGLCRCAGDDDCAPLDNGNACDGTLVCAARQCVLWPGSVVRCDPSDDTACRRATCDPQTGACAVQDVPDGTPCDDGSPCTGAPCSDAGDCPEADRCVAGVCRGDPRPAACPCASHADCAAWNDGDACNGQLSCDLDQGSCRIQADSIVRCPPDTAPCARLACQPATGECVEMPLPAGVPCDERGACERFEVCDGASLCALGQALPCDDGNPCTNDSCDPIWGCTFVPGSGACDSGSACTRGDHCAGGRCWPGEPLVCDDGNPCTDDTCSPGVGCVFAPNRVVCDDGDDCTADDRCFDGRCLGSPVCPCQSDADCLVYDDGDLCNGLYRCDNAGRACVTDPTSVVACDTSADEVCQQTVCVPDTGLCETRPQVDGSPCDDGDPCTVADTCEAGLCAGTAGLRCDDRDPCTLDHCDAGECSHSAIDACVQPCTRFEECVDRNPCTVDVCLAGICLHGAAPDDTLCEDDDPCTGLDRCTAGRCQAGAGQPCTPGSCQPLGVVQCGDVVAGETGDARATHAVDVYGCGGDPRTGPEHTYAMVAQWPLRVTARLTSDVELALFAVQGGATCEPFACFAGGADEISFTAQAGETYHLVIDGPKGVKGPYALEVACAQGEDCGNGRDDDDDGATDCVDDDCTGVAACHETDCTDGRDDDHDQSADCADDDCAAHPACRREADCGNEVDDDGDGATDCADDDCAAAPPCLPESQCDDGLDDDGDGPIDCADRDCLAWRACAEYACADAQDDDGDAATDCADPDCAPAPTCGEQACNDGQDDDGDGATDCADVDCWAVAACSEVDCTDGLDDDGDGATDCADVDCARRSPCDTQLCQTAAELTCGGPPVTVAPDDPEVTRRIPAWPAPCTLPDRGYGGSEIGFDVVAPCTGEATLRTQLPGTLQDDVFLLAGGGSCRAAACLAVTPGAPGTASASFAMTLGERYRLVLDGPAAPLGPVRAVLDCSCTPERETACGDGYDDDGDGQSDCADADCAADPRCALGCLPSTPLRCGATFTARLSGPAATSAIPAYPGCDGFGFGYPGPERTFPFHAPCSGPVTVVLEALEPGLLIDTYVLAPAPNGACLGERCLAAAYSHGAGAAFTVFPAQQNTLYYVVADRYLGGNGSFALRVECPCLDPPDEPDDDPARGR